MDILNTITKRLSAALASGNMKEAEKLSNLQTNCISAIVNGTIENKLYRLQLVGILEGTVS